MSKEQNSDWLTLFAAGSLASRSPMPGSGRARLMTVTSGRKCFELYPLSGRLGLLGKMYLESSAWRSTRCFLTWKISDTNARRLLFQLAPSMPRTEETDSGLWPTPLSAPESEASHNQVSGRYREAMNKRLLATPNTLDAANPKSQAALDHEATEHRPGRSVPGNLRDQIACQEGQRLWPTPRADAGGMHRGKPDTLPSAVKFWRTPQASEAGARVETLYTKDGEPARPGERAYRKQPDGKLVLQSVTIGQQVKMWHTPRATMPVESPEAFRARMNSKRKNDRKNGLPNLAVQAMLFPTPTVGMVTGGNMSRSGDRKEELLLNGLAKMFPTPTESDGMGGPSKDRDDNLRSRIGGQLNPVFVEWLMGFPLGWTDCGPSATRSSRKLSKK